MERDGEPDGGRLPLCGERGFRYPNLRRVFVRGVRPAARGIPRSCQTPEGAHGDQRTMQNVSLVAKSVRDFCHLPRRSGQALRSFERGVCAHGGTVSDRGRAVWRKSARAKDLRLVFENRVAQILLNCATRTSRARLCVCENVARIGGCRPNNLVVSSRSCACAQFLFHTRVCYLPSGVPSV